MRHLIINVLRFLNSGIQFAIKEGMNENQALTVLVLVRNRLGRNYKSAIRQAWENGNYSEVGLKDFDYQLQSIRNTFGPSWLVRARPIAPDKQPGYMPHPSPLGTRDSTPYVI